ncbi:acyl-CoA carboxylase subunit beta [Streptomyces noursei]|uniref:acyl-CoA carboxylase subunit beta n=1 Tax=Streptomyces noursei TaxID=1971 RepID=UPI0016729932|nr:acyl-CoA carboxylase subunit beta [Streptomyces noursei]MCZ1013271.1 acyl-CoA carboxylase subunit beta [Streptomyces noursei]GGX52591.1 methylmalonyl-CoA carboxyltransferase [Streptomyces noursei]
MTTVRDAFDDLCRRRTVVDARSTRMAGKQHSKGRFTALERIELLLDPDSFVELDMYNRPTTDQASDDVYGDGVITGYGTIDGRPVCVFSQDATFRGGSLGEGHAKRILKVMELAMKTGQPLIGINDGAGARIQEGVVSQAMYAEIFRRNVQASGVIPQISLIMGYCAGGAAYSPALTDFVVMVDRTSHMFITGPDVVRAVTGEEIDFEGLGGGRTHSTKSGNVHYLGTDEEDAISYVRDLLSYLPDNNASEPPVFDELDTAGRLLFDRSPVGAGEKLDTLIPDSPAQPYDMHEVIEGVVDDSDFLEVQELFAPNIIIGFARIEGRSVGVVANQPLQFAGCLDIDASEKAARFVRTCNGFNVPVLTFVDVPGFLPGTAQEWSGIIRRGAKLIYAYAEATVPLVTVITRKAYGAGYDVLGSKHLGADVNLAWPTAEIAVMGAQGATNIVHRRQLEQVRVQGGDVEAVRVELERKYQDRYCTPYVAAEHGYVDAVIAPSATRDHVARALRALRSAADPQRTSRGNMPV